jgi:DNA polymerase
MKDLAIISDQAGNCLKFLKSMGVTGFDCSEKSLKTLAEWGKPRPKSVKPETLDSIRADLGDCRRCRISEKRRNLVFGAGNPGARLMFIGEAPGYEEDMQGIPFVGESGQLLTKMIEAMGLARDQVYIANIIKCRPSENRNPAPEEIVCCFPFLERQIKAVNPEVICTLGAVATQALLGTQEGITRLRGNFQEYRSIRVMPTFHPAYLLRSPDKKREAWEDLKKVMAVLGLALPRPGKP